MYSETNKVAYIVCLLLVKGILCTVISSGETFTEELFVKPFENGHVYSHFQFTTQWNASIHNIDTFKHYNLFPKALGEVLSQYKVQELHLSQTQGQWRYKQWGYPIHDSPPGAELWVWFKPSVKNVDKTWKELVNAVSGLFCSSLNFLDGKITIAPRWSFKPQGVAPEGYSVFPRFVRYGTLPREMVCTENLTPWKKFLPCESKVGLSTLFNAFNFHDAEFHSLGLHIRPICKNDECTKDSIELSQSLSVVRDASLTSPSDLPNWSLRSLFGNALGSACSMAASSKIIVETTLFQGDVALNLSPPPSSTKKVMRGSEEHNYAVYDVESLVREQNALNIVGSYSSPLAKKLTLPPIHTHRYITGYGLEDGGVTCLIYSTMTTNQSIIYMDVLPWFTKFFFNSLKVENDGHSVPFKVHYQPAKDRVRPYHLELSFALWPNSVTKVTYSFTRAFLKWTEYPPDANHGFYIGSSVITAMIPSSRHYTAFSRHSSQVANIFEERGVSDFPVQVHTETLLVSLPTPDFSMPYNVICLACTVVAIAFGSIHNLTTKRLVIVDPSKKTGLIAKVKRFFSREKSDDASTEQTKTDGTKEKDIGDGDSEAKDSERS